MKPAPFATTHGGKPIAAWLLKANPKVWNVGAYFDENDVVDDWRLVDNYRTDLMAPGQLCFLWVTGNEGDEPTPGVWAAGVVRSDPYWEAGGGDLWLDPDEMRKRRPYVGLCLMKLDEPILRADLRGDRRFADAEILRQPQMSNPGVLSPGEVEAIADGMGDLAALLASLPEEEVSDFALALEAVAETAREDGYVTALVHDSELPFDLVLTRADEEPIAVAVVVTDPETGDAVIERELVDFARRAAREERAFGLAVVVVSIQSDEVVLEVSLEIPWNPLDTDVDSAGTEVESA